MSLHCTVVSVLHLGQSNKNLNWEQQKQHYKWQREALVPWAQLKNGKQPCTIINFPASLQPSQLRARRRWQPQPAAATWSAASCLSATHRGMMTGPRRGRLRALMWRDDSRWASRAARLPSITELCISTLQSVYCTVHCGCRLSKAQCRGLFEGEK